MRILCIYPHPDDESFGPAAALALYARQGAGVYGLFYTRGQHGEPLEQRGPSPEQMGRLRELDLRAATALIGFEAIQVLDYEDGQLADAPAEQLELHAFEAIQRYQPEVVVTFGPAGITRHPDHVAAHRAAVAAFQRARSVGLPVRELYYDALPSDRAEERGLTGEPDGQPNTWIEVAETAQVKVEALRLHGRHVKDAAERAEHLAREPQLVTPLHRAWPVVAEGESVGDFLEGAEG